MTLKRDEIRTLVAIAIGLPLLSGAGWWAWGPVVLLPTVTFVFVSLLGLGLAGLRRVRGEFETNLQHTQALLYLNSQLDLSHPLPPLGGAALTPDTAALLVGLINQQRPRLILELGSGVSTVVCATALKGLGEGRVVSLDHDAFYAGITRENIDRHGLNDWADVRDAPIEPTQIEGQTWQWYAMSKLPQGEPIDLLIVDGPPKKIQRLARYPALKLVIERLAPNAVILFDDTNRKQEREIVCRWMREFPDFSATEVPFGKGATIFRRGEIPSPTNALLGEGCGISIGRRPPVCETGEPRLISKNHTFAPANEEQAWSTTPSS